MTSLPRCVLMSCGLLAAALLSSCHEGAPPAEEPANSVASTSTRPVGSPVRANPDFGGVATQHVEVTATGRTLESAVDNAVRLAIEQVNGKRIEADTVQVRAGAIGEVNGQSIDMKSSAFANAVASATSGAVTHFRILSQKRVTNPSTVSEASLKASQGESWNRGSVDASANASASEGDASASANEHLKGGWDQKQGAAQVDYHGKRTEYATLWVVRIAADVASYREAASAKRTRVVVAQPRVASPAYRVGDDTIPSGTIGSVIQAQVTEALTQTHRFTVLDRAASPQMDQEIALIQSGNATPADTARLGHQLAADLIVIPTISRFEYIRHERQLRLAARTLVSYSGGGEVSFRVVNAVTGQIVISKSFGYAFPSTSPTTLGTSVDGERLATEMMNAVDTDFVAAMLQSTYPLAVLQVNDRNVVINQGGDAVMQGAVYQAVWLGSDVVDPQSGQSLGPTESPCCTIAVDRVTPKLSYGHIVERAVQIKSPFKAGSIELRGRVAATAPDQAQSRPKHERRTTTAKRTAQPAKVDNDANW